MNTSNELQDTLNFLRLSMVFIDHVKHTHIVSEIKNAKKAVNEGK